MKATLCVGPCSSMTCRLAPIRLSSNRWKTTHWRRIHPQLGRDGWGTPLSQSRQGSLGPRDSRLLRTQGARYRALSRKEYFLGFAILVGVAWVAAAIFLGLLLGFAASPTPATSSLSSATPWSSGEVQGPPHMQSTGGLSALSRAAEGPGSLTGGWSEPC